MKKIGILSLALCSACFNGNASDDVVVTEQVQLPTVPTVSAGGAPMETFSFTLPQPIDITNALSKLNSIGDVSLAAESDISGADMSWVDHATVTLTPVANNMNPGLLVDGNSNGTNSINLPVSMSSDAMKAYFGDGGGVYVTFTLTGSNVPTDGPTLTWGLRLHANVSIKKSL
jgi:hypothetical protein